MVCSSTFRTAVNSYRFKLISFGAVYTDEFDTQVCHCNGLKDLRGHAAECIPVQIPIKSLLKGQVVCVCAHFFFNTIYVVRYLFSSRVFYTLKDLEHLETDF